MSHAKFERYDAYKNNGVEWLSKVPEHWDMQRLKDIKSSVSNAFVDGPFGSNLKTEHFVENGAVYVIDSGFITSGKFEKKREFKTISFEHFLTVRRSECCYEDIIISKIGANFGMSGILPELDKPSLVSGNTLKISINKKKFFLKFIHYQLLNLKVNGVFDLLVKGSAQPALSLGLLNSVTFPVPPLLHEQTVIADYLDTKTEQIDRKIDLLTQKAIQYGKLKQSLINETVTRGLDKTVAMKDSGVEWIGEVPEHWVVNRLKDIFNERTDKGYPDEPLLIASQDKGVTLKASYSRHTMTVQKDFHMQKLVKKADFVISLRSFEGGIETAHYQGIISAAYTILYPINEQGSGYYKHLFKSSKFISLLVTHTTGIREGRNINYQQLKRDFIPVPNQVERQEIASYLDTKTTHIDRIVETINTQIDKLKELRKTLINDVVTGKIKVA